MLYKIFGIRHHGPGSARSLLAALQDWQPDCLLIEGPSEAQAALDWICHSELVPPVALLIYRPDQPREAVYYPFAAFSPEWQALRWAKQAGVPIRWMDLPQQIQLGMQADKQLQHESTGAANEANELPASLQTQDDSQTNSRHLDPFQLLAQATGYHDGESYWEELVEQRRETGDIFEALTTLMAALREGQPLPERDALREAWMRQSLRQSLSESFERIAVVCGAWHVPALDPELPVKADQTLLKGLEKKHSKVKVQACWIPWTHSRLSWNSGYGAGIESPGWYAHLWAQPVDTNQHWMVRVAQLLRQSGLDVSSAHVIDAVRLAEALAALRGKSYAGLNELNEACLSVICQGQNSQLKLIEEKLMIGSDLGSVPAEMPMLPLQVDFETQIKALRLKLSAQEAILELDLRKDRDRNKSSFLHRLNLMQIPWGQIQTGNKRKGSFAETWKLVWEPEFALRLIEASVWGLTLEQAASALALEQARKAQDLPSLTRLLDLVLLADLGHVLPELLQNLQAQAALSHENLQLMAALPPLGRILRYGSVRQFDTADLSHLFDGLLARVCLSLPAACYSLDEQAAQAMLKPLAELHDILQTLQNPLWTDVWLVTLADLAERETVHAHLRGYVSRLLFDLDNWSLQRLQTEFSRLLSPGIPLMQASVWIEGFLQGSGLILVHHPSLLSVLDQWVCHLKPDDFMQALPLLRRSFASFATSECRQIGELIRQSATGQVKAGADSYHLFGLNPDVSGILALSRPILQSLLGAKSNE